MAKKRGIKAGGAYVELNADKGPLSKALRQAGGLVRGFAGVVKKAALGIIAIGAAGVAAGFSMARSFASAGDALEKMSARTGVSAESLSELKFAAERSGASIEDVEGAVRAMQRGLFAAKKGTGEAKEGLDALGLSVDQLAGMSPEKQMEVIADSISGVVDPTEQAAIAMRIFGDSGTRLLPMMANGAAGMQSLRKEARDLGVVLNDADAKAAAGLTDALGDAWAVMKSVGLQIGAALAPAVTWLADTFAGAASHVVKFIDRNAWLVQSFDAVAGGAKWLWTSLRIAWLEGTQAIYENMSGVIDPMLKGWANLDWGIRSLITELTAWIEGTFGGLWINMRNKMNSFIGEIAGAMGEVYKWYDKDFDTQEFRKILMGNIEADNNRRSQRDMSPEAIERRRQAAQDELAKKLDASIAKIDNGEAIEGLKQELASLRSDRQAAADDLAIEHLAALASDAKDMADAVNKANGEGGNGLLGQTASRLSTQSTFQSGGLPGITSTAMSRTAEAAEETARNTRKTNDLLEGSGGTPVV